MADWLEKIEQEKERERRRIDAAWERSKPERERRNAEEKKVREQYQGAIDKTLEDIKEYTNRARRATGNEFEVEEKRRSERNNYPELKIRGKGRRLEITGYSDELSIYVSQYTPSSVGGYMKTFKHFKIHINNVTQEHISSWIKWLSTGETPVTYSKDVVFEQTASEKYDAKGNQRLAVMALIAIAVIFVLCKACSGIH